jgi:phosphoribosylanthranilate isomerase
VLSTRVKICGITRVEDAELAVRLGADALGLVFYPASKRAVTVAQAQAVRHRLSAFVALTGLFVNADSAEINAVLAQVRIDCLQFHGEETPEFCASFGMPYMKAIRVRQGLDVVALAAQYHHASAILLDSYDPHQAGGTGLSFDWAVARDCVQRCGVPIVLAGGLTAQNVAAAIKEVQPYAVDVSSGVESVPGLKCPDKMQAFFKEVYRVQS